MTDSRAAEWPVEIRGVTESVVATLGPNGKWNFAALGIHADEPVTARTWGRTRTRRNFHEEGGGVVQFLCDPVVFAESALAVHERDSPVHPSTNAWARVAVESVDEGESGGTGWEQWELAPVETGVENRVVPTTNRGYGALVEATVAASRLDVAAYDTEKLRERLDYLDEVVETCGGKREREALSRIAKHTVWTPEEE
jgi:hypothetical protein